jgi:adenine phosphoribosyltransferase
MAENEYKLYLNEEDVRAMEGKRVLIVDDVISSEESLRALEALVDKADGITVSKAALVSDAETAKRDGIVYLEPLPELEIPVD